MKPESAWYCRQVKGLQRSPSPVRPQPVLPLARQESRPDSPPSPAAMPDRSRPSGADPHSHREQEVWGGQTAGWRQEVAAGRAPNGGTQHPHMEQEVWGGQTAGWAPAADSCQQLSPVPGWPAGESRPQQPQAEPPAGMSQAAGHTAMRRLDKAVSAQHWDFTQHPSEAYREHYATVRIGALGVVMPLTLDT